jgi:orotidine-5'-phosphate decarboxylase
MSLSGLIPSAFKPNIGYYQSLDRPRDEDFSGSLALVDVMDMVENFFPGIPVILDSKRGDIARSSLNYAMEAFDCWQSDAVTVAPYMGSDSITPFASHVPGEKGIYILNRTSNPGGKDFQNLMVSANGASVPLYMEVARKIASLREEFEGLGAVVGATNMAELTKIATYYADKKIPLLIPGVGSQGGSASEVMAVLRDVGYPVQLARINSSSALTHPWKKGPAPEDWLELCEANLRTMIEETAL